MTIQTTPIKRVTLTGSPVQMGYQHGETLRSEIAGLFHERIRLIVQLTDCPIETVQHICHEVIDVTKELLPEVYSELAATAKSANVEQWQLLVAGGFSDVLDRCAKIRGSSAYAKECTLATIRLADGRPLLIGTWDTHATAQDFLVIVERQPAGKPRSVSLSTAGWPMQQGLNESGLGYAIANMAARKNSYGTSYICAIMSASEQASAYGAATVTGQIPLCSARYFVFVDGAGVSRSLEHDGDRTYKTDEFTAHTNHFLSKQGVEIEGRPVLVKESEGRRRLMEHLLSTKMDDIKDVFDVLSFRDPDQYSIMKLGTGTDDRTCAAFAISPADLTMWYTVGPPAGAEIKKVYVIGN